MSVRPTLITDEIADYILTNFSAEDEFLYNLRQEAAKLDIPPIHISAEEGAFLQFLLRAVNARNVLEIGSLAGYSAITMARALPPGGKLVSLEIELEYAHFIKRKAEEAGLSDIIEVHNVDALKYLSEFNGDFKFDFVFMDAEKHDYIKYFELSERILKKGGVIAADNALAFGEIVTDFPETNREVEAIREFNKYFRSRKDFQSCLVPVGDGIAIGIKL